jgi:hypothetical protein
MSRGDELRARNNGTHIDSDRLTVLMHELRHVLGSKHGDSTIMSASRTTGERFIARDDFIAPLWVEELELVEIGGADADTATESPAATVVGKRFANHHRRQRL